MSGALAHEYEESQPWPRAASGKPQFSIGGVVARLQKEFPALTISKVRYLEEQGIVTPARTASGYRKFSSRDIERLRFCLAAQRDTFKPIASIREELAVLDAGKEIAVVPVARIVSDDGVAREPLEGQSLTARDIMDFTGVDESVLVRLRDCGLLQADVKGRYPSSAVKMVRLAARLNAAGLSYKNMRFIATFGGRLADSLETINPAKRATGVESERRRVRNLDLMKVAVELAEIAAQQQSER